MILEFEHPSKISSKELVIFKELDSSNSSHKSKIDLSNASMLLSEMSLCSSSGETNNSADPSPTSIYSSPSRYEIFSGSLQIAAIKPDLDKPNPKMGVSCIQFSCDNRFMFTRNDSMPNILWIWDMSKFKLTNVLIQTMAIRHVCWDSRQCRLALCTNNNKVYMWSPQGCISVEAPCEATFLITALKWNPDGNSLILIGKDQFCVTYLQTNANGGESQKDVLKKRQSKTVDVTS